MLLAKQVCIAKPADLSAEADFVVHLATFDIEQMHILRK